MCAASVAEVSLSEKAFLESRLAITLALKPDLFPTVAKISALILECIRVNRAQIIEVFSKSENTTEFDGLVRELYRDDKRGALGAITKPDGDISIETVLNDIELALKNPTNLINIMPIHATVGFRITRILFKDDFKCTWDSFSSVLQEISTIRTAARTGPIPDNDLPLTQQLGICRDAETCERLNALSETDELSKHIDLAHRNSLQRFTINTQSTLLKEKFQGDVPLVAGLSTHTLTLLTSALVCEKRFLKDNHFSKTELNEYALAYFSYFATAGYHSFHEVMAVAAAVLEMPYVPTSYLDNILHEEVKQFIETNHLLSIDDASSLQENSSSPFRLGR